MSERENVWYIKYGIKHTVLYRHRKIINPKALDIAKVQYVTSSNV